MVSYIVSWFYWFYFILSADETFPNAEDVGKAVTAELGREHTEETQATIDKCTRLFWFQPASTLRGLLPGLLDKWDNAYTVHFPSYVPMNLCDPTDKRWRVPWKKYANSMIDDMAKLGESSSYVKLPSRATSRLRYFLFCMSNYHNATIFPTKTFIRDMTRMFDKSREAFCDVCTIPHHSPQQLGSNPRDKFLRKDIAGRQI